MNEELFKNHQKKLLWLVNTSFGKDIFSLNKSSFADEKIVNILPNSITIRLGENEYATEFYTYDKFSERIYFLTKYLHKWDTLFANRFVPSLNLGFDTLTKKPDGTHLDSQVQRNGVNESFANIRVGAGTNATNLPNTITYVSLAATGVNDVYGTLIRYIAEFDTSLLGGSMINSGTISFYGESGNVSSLGQPQIDIASASPANPANIVASDFSNVGSTILGSLPWASWANNVYNDFTLNSSGLANISLGGTSGFSMRLDWDLSGNTTGLVWANAQITNLSGDGSGVSGKEPKLTVIYTRPGTILFELI